MKQVIVILVLRFSDAVGCPAFSVSDAPMIANKESASRRLIASMITSIQFAAHSHFVYHRSMSVETNTDISVARIAAAIGEPARARMLYSLIDGHARTGTELAAVAEVGASTASVHLGRLMKEHLVKVVVQGKHRYYSLKGNEVADALEALSVLAGGARDKFVPNTPSYLRVARTCYDHIAGALGVQLHDRLKTLDWFAPSSNGRDDDYDVTQKGMEGLIALGVDLDATRQLRRRFAFACLDWSERRSHLGGAVGAALLDVALRRKWVMQDAGNRALSITHFGRRDMLARLGLQV